MRSRRFAWLAVLLGLCVGVVPALASTETDPTVSGQESIMWSPAEVTVAPGGAVTFQDTSGVVPHGVVWETGDPETPACSGVPIDEGKTSWKGSCTFATPGTYRYYCSVHGMAMSGTVAVGSGSTTSSTPTQTTSLGGVYSTTPTTPSSGEAIPEELVGTPLVGSASQAVKLRAIQRGKSVSGSVAVSAAGVGASLEVDLLVGGNSLNGARRSTPVRVGRLARPSVAAGNVRFAVQLDAVARAALRRHRHLTVTVKLKLTPIYGQAVVVTRVVVVHASTRA